jgi:hypothetical protein
MSFGEERNAKMPAKWVFKTGYGSSLVGLDTPGGHIHPEAAVGNSKGTPITRAGLVKTSSVNRGVGFGLDPPLSNGFSTNTEFLDDFSFPSVAEEEGPYMTEDVRPPLSIWLLS